MKLIIDITRIYNWNTPPTGIVRVELELIKYVLKKLNSAFYVFARIVNTSEKVSFDMVSNDEISNIINKIEFAQSQVRKQSCAKKIFAKKLIKLIVPNMWHPF